MDWGTLEYRMKAGETWPMIVADSGIEKGEVMNAVKELGADMLHKAQESCIVSPERAERLTGRTIQMDLAEEAGCQKVSEKSAWTRKTAAQYQQCEMIRFDLSVTG